MKCTRCKWNYPDSVGLSPLIGSDHNGEVCGICAREIRAAIHGIDIPFRKDSLAWEYEMAARKYRKANPRKAPNER